MVSRCQAQYWFERKRGRRGRENVQAFPLAEMSVKFETKVRMGRKRGEVIILSAYADYNPGYTISLHKTVFDVVQNRSDNVEGNKSY